MNMPTTPLPDYAANSDAILGETSEIAQDTLKNLLQQPVPPTHKVDGIALGFVRGFNSQGQPILDIPAFDAQGVLAQSTVPLDISHLGSEVAIGFMNGNASQALVLGLIIQAHHTKLNQTAHLQVDGERITIQAQQELELRCGDAAIVLTSDGNVHIRGQYITSHASATQRISGGAVRVN